VIYRLLDLLQLACIIVVLAVGRRTARDAFRRGYWTGKSEIHNSLSALLAEHHAELMQEPAKIVDLLNEWYLSQLMGDKLLAQAQGLAKGA